MRAHFFSSRIFLVLLFVFANGYAYADFGELSSLAAALGFKPEDEKRLLSGEVITADLPETTDKMLAASFAIYAPMHTYKVADLALSERVFDADTKVIASGRIDPLNIEASFSKAKFTSADSQELKQLKKFTGGGTFNLSTEEIAKLRAAIASGQTSADALSKVYRGILIDRMKAYLKLGIYGVAPYDRGKGKKNSVMKELEAMTKASKLLAKDSPGLYRTFLDYPRNQSLHIEHGFFWIKRKIENRPGFVLEHRILERGPVGLTILKREFFVGHSYDAAQTISGAYTIANEGTLFFSTVRSSTDRIAGAMSGTRHTIARKMMRDQLIARFKNMRKHFAK
jgi:hypothetical protein